MLRTHTYLDKPWPEIPQLMMFSATWFFLTQLWNAAWFSPTYAIQVFLSLLSYLFGIGDDLATQFAIPSYMRILFLAFACISTGYAGLVAVRTALFWPFRRVHDTLAAIVCPKQLYSEPRPYGSVQGLPGIEVLRPQLLPCRFPPFGATYGRSGNPNLDAYIVPNREFWLTRLYNRDITYGYTGSRHAQPLYFIPGPGSIIVDPWRKYESTNELNRIIHYGNSRLG